MEPLTAFAARSRRADERQPDRRRERIRELAERISNGKSMRLFWLQGTSELWVEVYEPELDMTLVIPAEPERALEVFNHPFAYGAADSAPSRSSRE
jgi:hypothetical protein